MGADLTRPRIVVLDGYTLNPGDLSWDALAALGELKVYDRTPPERVLERAAGAPLVLTNKTRLFRESIDALRDLRYIGVLATGYDVVDAEAAKRRGIPVTNVPGYGTASVAQTVFALLLELCHRTGLHADSVRAGEWTTAPDWCYWKTPLMELESKTLGIVGYGRIGERVATIALTFGMRVLAHRRNPPNEPPQPGVRWAGLNELLAESDVVSLHCPLTPETRGLIDRDAIARMKRGAMLINTAHGPLVSVADLAEALRSGHLAGAGLDVLAEEPLRPDNPLLSAPNCVITPHIAWATREARERLLRTAIGNVEAFLAGRTTNCVNGVQ